MCVLPTLPLALTYSGLDNTGTGQGQGVIIPGWEINQLGGANARGLILRINVFDEFNSSQGASRCLEATGTQRTHWHDHHSHL